MRPSLKLVLLALTTLVAPHELAAQKKQHDLITRDEIQQSPQVGKSLYEAILALRPHFLEQPRRSREVRPFASAVAVRIDGLTEWNAAALKSVAAGAVQEVRYLEPRRAEDELGRDYSGGAIVVRLYKPGSAPSAVAVAEQTAGGPPAPGGARPRGLLPSDSAILAIIKQRVDDKRSAGIVVGVIDSTGKSRIVAYGDPGPGQPPLDGTSVFEIGSITKVFTGTALAVMMREGKVSLNDPIQKYLPATVRVPTRSDKVITLGMLAQQNSGLPRLPANMDPKDPTNPYADYTVQQMYDFLSAYQLPRDPGATYEYSNLGVGLLGHVLSLAAGKPYEQLERDLIWTPLGMTNTAITFTPWMKQHLALGHDDRGSVVANWDLPTLAGAGAIRSTTNDMLKFLDANLHAERGALQAAMAFAQKERAPAGPMRIGLNWHIRFAGADTIVWHNGGTGGYRTFIGFMPSRRIGVVVMTNSGGAGADDVGFHLLNPALPLTPKPAPPKQRTAVDVSADVLSRYVGVYQLAPTFTLEVTVKDGGLYVHPTAQPVFRLWPESETDFFLKEVDAQVTFVRGADGKATSLVLHQNGADQTATKVR